MRDRQANVNKQDKRQRAKEAKKEFVQKTIVSDFVRQFKKIVHVSASSKCNNRENN